MPRKPRLHVPGGLYHVILRGNDRQAIFYADGDRHRWMRLLGNGIGRYHCRIHAYCWMTNHIHMAVQVSDLPLGRLISWVVSQYAKATNNRLHRSGHLFERRYRGRLVDTDVHLLQLVRYIHNNPVEARVVDDPARYLWSSHRAYLGHRRPGLLTTDWVLSFFGQSRLRSVKAYGRFMAEEHQIPTELLESNPDDGRLLGDDDFTDRMNDAQTARRSSRTLNALITECCQRYNIAEAALASPRRSRLHARLRAEIAIAAQDQRIATLHDVARYFNRSDSALCHSIRHYINSRRGSDL